MFQAVACVQLTQNNYEQPINPIKHGALGLNTAATLPIKRKLSAMVSYDGGNRQLISYK